VAPIGRTLSIAPASCDASAASGGQRDASLLSIAPNGPATTFAFQVADDVGAGLAAAAQIYLPRIAALDSQRLGIRQVPDKLMVVMQRFDGSWMGETNVGGVIDDEQRVSIASIGIRLNTAQVQTPDELQLTFGHEYVHAMHDSLGLVRLPPDIREGLGYWVDYSNIYYPLTGGPIDSWQRQVVGSWDLIRDLALTGRTARTGRLITDPGRLQLGALTTGYIESRVGLHRWLEILVTADVLRVDRNALVARDAGASWPELQAAVQTMLARPDGGLAAFTAMARSH